MGTVSKLPFRVERIPNDAPMEFVFKYARSMEPAAGKRFIMEARAPEVGLLNQQQADIALDALNLRLA